MNSRLIAGSFLIAGACTVHAAKLTPGWVELGPSGAIARVIMDGKTGCPKMNLDGRSEPMRARVDNPSLAFPVRVCEAAISQSTKKASIEFGAESQQLVLPVANPRRILVIGDTGCRIKDTAQLPPAERVPGGKSEIQDCEDPSKWPFKQLARSAAAEKPDLVIHVGDYLYRETPCPDPAKCGNIYGYDWPGWNADFFAPAASLLQAAPWIFVRGNHEDCGRAWQGFYFFLDPRDFSQLSPCASPYTDPYVVKLGSQNFAVLDSALANDVKAPEDEVKEYSRQLKSIVKQGVDKGWILTHRPIWAFRSTGGKQSPLNATLGAAWEKADLTRSDVSLVLAGHVHLFELLSFAPPSKLPPQLVVGDSGTQLAAPLPADLAGSKIAKHVVAKGESFDSFSYGLMTREPSGWHLKMRSPAGADKADCRIDLKAGTVACQ
jgi:predicted phosphodiesterase